MRTDAYIEVTCDNCGECIQVPLTAIARGGYDERYVDAELESMGWNVDNDLCPDCKNLKVKDVKGNMK